MAARKLTVRHFLHRLAVAWSVLRGRSVVFRCNIVGAGVVSPSGVDSHLCEVSISTDPRHVPPDGPPRLEIRAGVTAGWSWV